jgi:NADPH:quinone reductase-like Zn-dependent oxidoreductase
MRVLHAYAPSDPTRLALEEAPPPEPGTGDVLLRVHASGVSPAELEWRLTWQYPDGSPRQPPIVLGHEVSGVVEALGPGDTDGLAVGDPVFGLIDFRRDGAHAELVAVRATELVAKPPALTHESAAAAPLSALTAWQALFEQGELQPGQRVLIHGGAGGVGSYAVQLARWRGANVVATSSARDAELVRELGADEVVDYRAQRFEDVVSDADLVFDTVGGETWERSVTVLRPGGRLVSIATPRPPDRELDDGRRAIFFIVRPDRDDLRDLAGLLEAGDVRPIVSAVLPFDHALKVYGPDRPSTGPGKVVLRVAGDRQLAGTGVAAATAGT